MRKFAGLFAAFVLAATLVACSSANRELLRAHAMQERGEYSKALDVYQAMLPRIPLTNIKTRSSVLMEIGECLFNLGRLPEAFSAYQKTIELDNNNVLAHMRMGELFLAAGAIDRAKEQAQIVVQKSSGSNDALALLGSVWAASGNAALAQDAYKKVLTSDPKRVQVSIELADLYNRENQPENARKVLHDSAAALPHNPQPLLALGRLEEESGDIAAAESAYRQAVQSSDTPETNLRLAQFLERTARVPEAEQVLRHVDVQRASSPTALPDFQLLSGDADGALESYNRRLSDVANQRTPKDAPHSVVEELRAERAQLAARLIEADLESVGGKANVDRKAAAAHAHADLERYRPDLDAATASVLDAEVALAADDIPGARSAAELAVTQAPQSAAAHYELGVTRFRAGDPGGARTEWDSALDNDPRFTPARLAMAQYAMAAGDLDGAEQYVIPVVREEPGNLRALETFARVLLLQKNPGPAALIARRALVVGSASPGPHLILGEIALQQSQLADALVQFEQAVLLEPRSERAVEDLTRVYQQGVITRPALQRMEKVASSDPPSATLMEIAGRLYQQRGWHSDAQRCLAAALKIDPQRVTAAAALAQSFAATGQLSEAADTAAKGGARSAALLSALRADDEKNVQSAMQNYEKAVREGDHSGVAANNLAWMYAQHGMELDRALQLAETARQQAPENPAVLDTIGVVHLRRREYSQAIKALETAKTMAAMQASKGATDSQVLAAIRRHLSEAYLRAGQPAAAALVARLRPE